MDAQLEQILDKLEENPALGKKVEEVWMKYVPFDKIAEALGEEGLDITAAQIQEVIETMQKARAEEIAAMEVDDDVLKKVAGGDHGCSTSYSCEKSTYQCRKTSYKQCTSNYNCTTGEK